MRVPLLDVDGSSELSPRPSIHYRIQYALHGGKDSLCVCVCVCGGGGGGQAMASYTVEPLNNITFGTSYSVHYREVSFLRRL